ncbi:hypothetical protein LXH09_37245 [Streptomyces sp. CS7]|uniref:hypothetical protein n=1 Tax=Streptomyces sp. CS-7 TaxID=2906769 RepID=UPI0021B383D4|nr:hypothetical protein [Streptomyces sp. CS-7]MCT6782271.1 hypothetical protein [Streptomyces sp. CS-7]
MSEKVPDAVVQRPWTEADGVEPEVYVYPRDRAPGLYIKVEGRWTRSAVLARHTHPDRGVSYQVDTSRGAGIYRWDQPGVRWAYDPWPDD